MAVKRVKQSCPFCPFYLCYTGRVKKTGEPGTADTGRAGTGYRTDIIHRAWQRGESPSRAEPLLSCKPPGGRLCSVHPMAADGLAYICGLCYAVVAQLVERLLWEQEAVGSRPTGGTINRAHRNRSHKAHDDFSLFSHRRALRASTPCPPCRMHRKFHASCASERLRDPAPPLRVLPGGQSDAGHGRPDVFLQKIGKISGVSLRIGRPGREFTPITWG